MRRVHKSNGLALFAIPDFSTCENKYWPDLWPVETRDVVRSSIIEARSGILTRFRALCPTATGQKKAWETTVSPILGPGNTVVRLLAISRDITDELETRTARDIIVELLPAPLLVKSAESGRYILLNQAAEDMLGRTRAEVLGNTAFELFPTEEAEAFAIEDQAVIRSGKV